MVASYPILSEGTFDAIEFPFFSAEISLQVGKTALWCGQIGHNLPLMTLQRAPEIAVHLLRAARASCAVLRK